METNLLPLVAQGNESAINECLDRYGDLIWSLARRRLPNSADTEDAVQEIFVEIWSNAGRFDAQVASEKAFVLMLARRRIIDRQRKLGRTIKEEVIDEGTLAEPATVREDAVELVEEAAKAKGCMDKLSADQRQVLEFAIFDSLSQTQISDRTRIPLGTVKSHARRGLIQLRDCMGLLPFGRKREEVSS